MSTFEVGFCLRLVSKRKSQIYFGRRTSIASVIGPSPASNSSCIIIVFPSEKAITAYKGVRQGNEARRKIGVDAKCHARGGK